MASIILYHLVKPGLLSDAVHCTFFRSVPRIFKKIISPDYKGIVCTLYLTLYCSLYNISQLCNIKNAYDQRNITLKRPPFECDYFLKGYDNLFFNLLLYTFRNFHKQKIDTVSNYRKVLNFLYFWCCREKRLWSTIFSQRSTDWSFITQNYTQRNQSLT